MPHLDTNLADVGAYSTQGGGCVGGSREGHVHLADAIMQFVGCRKPKTGYSSNCTAI